MFSAIKAQLMKDIHPDGDSFPISFTTDIWTRDAGGDPFISWTAHYIDPITFTQEESVLQVCLFAGSHTALAISEAITKLWTFGKFQRPEYTLLCMTTLPIWWQVLSSVAYQQSVVQYIPFN